MKNSCAFYIVFQVLKVLLMNICQVKPSDLLFLFVSISFYISRYHFSEIFSIIWKKKIVTNFPFLANSLSSLDSCNGQNLLSMAKVFCWYSFSMNSVYDFWDTVTSHRFLEPFLWNRSVWKEGLDSVYLFHNV